MGEATFESQSPVISIFNLSEAQLANTVSTIPVIIARWYSWLKSSGDWELGF